ncbi:hypothetical protein TRFO_12967 [Tritrichomonas foetus]|uniref:Right handed beta helix domain-containing protein n=1 Tax=Tritrichomonas foetus TaxID=1144522 RepID=A0A1J4L456_9EUKA|nr:hypothetical protein TRFO_12967 [Tritrichomonas foetus]|eukprot:OHT16709.1 hypothetical protein TRFO_12967 [Tritrichomonas foetus]
MNFLNYSLVFLTLSNITKASPLLISSAALNFNFYRVKSKFFFSNFIYSSLPVSFNSCKFQYYLKSAIILSNSNYKDQYFNSQLQMSNTTIKEATITCCFFNSITSWTGGGGTQKGAAIYQNISWINLTIENSAFKKCRATEGGAIFSNSINVTSKSNNFYLCESYDKATGIYTVKSNKHQQIEITDAYFHDCTGGGPPLYLESPSASVKNVNITGSSGGPPYGGIYIQSEYLSDLGIDLQYINLINNNGEHIVFVLEPDEAPFRNFNFINNSISLYLMEIKTDETRMKGFNLRNMSFVGNTPSNYSICEPVIFITFYFSNCFFEFPESQQSWRIGNKNGVYDSVFSTNTTIQIKVNVESKSWDVPATATFSATAGFTPSSAFIPRRTPIPDGRPNIMANAVQKNIFSKEELVKSAVPFTLSLIVIVSGIAGATYYIRKRIQHLKVGNSDDFDNTFIDRMVSELHLSSSDNSFDYYTYSYSQDEYASPDYLLTGPEDPGDVLTEMEKNNNPYSKIVF